ncbi:hypothetical protein SLS58_011236 [Diplodia intermedia]|uniref:Uncharacterized protein n=1 Tax=Diplodia intermedia TaxID=856260 RepID=A0ABR3T0C9_9PEZI
MGEFVTGVDHMTVADLRSEGALTTMTLRNARPIGHYASGAYYRFIPDSLALRTAVHEGLASRAENSSLLFPSILAFVARPTTSSSTSPSTFCFRQLGILENAMPETTHVRHDGGMLLIPRLFVLFAMLFLGPSLFVVGVLKFGYLHVLLVIAGAILVVIISRVLLALVKFTLVLAWLAVGLMLYCVLGGVAGEDDERRFGDGADWV